MKRFYLLLLACVCEWALAPALARADTEPALLNQNGQCAQFAMCAAQTATGDCTVSPATGDERILNVFGKWSSFTFYGNQSVDAFSCVVHSNATGHDAESGAFVLISSTPISDSNKAITINGGNFGHIWMNCTSITTSATITVNACPGNR